MRRGLAQTTVRLALDWTLRRSRAFASAGLSSGSWGSFEIAGQRVRDSARSRLSPVAAKAQEDRLPEFIVALAAVKMRVQRTICRGGYCPCAVKIARRDRGTLRIRHSPERNFANRNIDGIRIKSGCAHDNCSRGLDQRGQLCAAGRTLKPTRSEPRSGRVARAMSCRPWLAGARHHSANVLSRQSLLWRTTGTLLLQTVSSREADSIAGQRL